MLVQACPVNPLFIGQQESSHMTAPAPHTTHQRSSKPARAPVSPSYLLNCISQQAMNCESRRALYNGDAIRVPNEPRYPACSASHYKSAKAAGNSNQCPPTPPPERLELHPNGSSAVPLKHDQSLQTAPVPVPVPTPSNSLSSHSLTPPSIVSPQRFPSHSCQNQTNPAKHAKPVIDILMSRLDDEPRGTDTRPDSQLYPHIPKTTKPTLISVNFDSPSPLELDSTDDYN